MASGYGAVASASRRPRPQRRRGFTLIEVLVVVVIIAVLAGFAVLQFSNRALDDLMDTEGRRLQRLFVLAAEEALFKGQELGFRFDGNRYEVLLRDPDTGKWEPVEDTTFRAREVPDPLRVQLLIDGRPFVPPPPDEGEPPPQVMLWSSGEATAFVLELRAPQHRTVLRLEGDVMARFTLAQAEVLQ